MGQLQKLILSTMSKRLGEGSQDMANEVCWEMGIKFVELDPQRVGEFSRILQKKAEAELGATDAKTMANIVSHFEKWSLA